MRTSLMGSYYSLTKPGIIYGNALPAAAGFLLASNGYINWILFVVTLLGLSFVIASACVFNNYYDRNIDGRMERTKTRVLVVGTIGGQSALLFATLLGLAGALALFLYVNPLAFEVAATGWLVYVVLYTPLKHRSAHALWVGAVAGATPPVVGYVAVSNSLDMTALWLVVFLFIWQIPHFLAIAVYRFNEYHSAGVPLFITHEPSAKAKHWGKLVFRASLIVLLLWCALIAFVL